ncbi:SH3 domain-containing protein [Flexistipes sinusarabici]|nr:SH3 domain-containing protein [Flexistipes sinusarabici]
MFNKFFIAFLLCVGFVFNGFCEEKTGGFVESLGVIKANVVYVRDKPDLNARRIRTFYEGAKIIVTGEQGKWYKVKVNNVRSGYALKKDISFKDTLGGSSESSSYFDKKLSLSVKSFIDRFNFNMIESGYFQKEGIVPIFKYKQLQVEDSTVKLELIYTTEKKKERVDSDNMSNPFEKELKYFMEVVIFKLINSPYENFHIEVFSNTTGNNGSFKKYAEFSFNRKRVNFEKVKDFRGEIWNYVKTSADVSEIFTKYPAVK